MTPMSPITAIDTVSDPACETVLLSLLDVEFGTAGIDAETELVESGHLDSLAVLELVLIIEEAFGVEMSDEDVVPEHFRSVRTIAGLVARLRA